MMTKFCVDCKWHERVDCETKPLHLCTRPQPWRDIIDVVTGERLQLKDTLCKIARERPEVVFGGRPPYPTCGPDAAWFEPKETAK